MIGKGGGGEGKERLDRRTWHPPLTEVDQVNFTA